MGDRAGSSPVTRIKKGIRRATGLEPFRGSVTRIGEAVILYFKRVAAFLCERGMAMIAIPYSVLTSILTSTGKERARIELIWDDGIYFGECRIPGVVVVRLGSAIVGDGDRFFPVLMEVFLYGKISLHDS